jgi:hypothetical protein
MVYKGYELTCCIRFLRLKDTAGEFAKQGTKIGPGDLDHAPDSIGCRGLCLVIGDSFGHGVWSLL